MGAQAQANGTKAMGDALYEPPEFQHVPTPAYIIQEEAREPMYESREEPMPAGWQWPEWCFEKGAVEVYVVDDEEGDNRWLPGDVKNRIVDEEGNDSYLCAEYVWDGERYFQDFGPAHVRRR